ncbi:MAG TPA: PadR family transcriptional regulator [Thermomicrobiales bacterium]|jgi:DNA-binding PadR family transcriptional regulator|nr:PadR family transcriptional regulator [Thermomicrobiales bacterium]
MSSIRLFILGSLEQHGPMHGHQLRLLAEREHIDTWTDISVGSLYGAIKRLAAEGLIEEVRTEREGAYPPRQVWAITHEGRASVGSLRMGTLREIVFKPDPFDLALTRLDPDHLDDLPAMIDARLASLRAMLADNDAHLTAIRRYLSTSEVHATEHRQVRLRAEIAWHESLLEALPAIIEDERARHQEGRSE